MFFDTCSADSETVPTLTLISSAAAAIDDTLVDTSWVMVEISAVALAAVSALCSRFVTNFPDSGVAFHSPRI